VYIGNGYVGFGASRKNLRALRHRISAQAHVIPIEKEYDNANLARAIERFANGDYELVDKLVTKHNDLLEARSGVIDAPEDRNFTFPKITLPTQRDFD
jgi:hypothetical protein